MSETQAQNNFLIKIEGQDLPDDLKSLLMTAQVEDNLNLPGMFQISFRDPDRTVLAKAHAEVGKAIEIKVATNQSAAGEKLLEGEITAVEMDFDPGGTRTMIRGYDVSHRLFRGRHTTSWNDSTYDDVVKKVAGRADVPTGTIDATTPVHKHVSQGNVNDWTFLKALAKEVGYLCTVSEGKLQFRKPDESSEAPAAATNVEEEDPRQLILGQNLLRFRVSVTAAEQVKEVEVRGWDVAQKKEVVGKAPAKTASAQIGADPASLAGKFGNPRLVYTDIPFGLQPEVDNAAKGLADFVAGAFAELEGVARGNPKLKAGESVSLGVVGAPFEGKYVLTTTKHIWDPGSGYRTWFTVSGVQERSLFGLSSGMMGNEAIGAPIYGVVSAIVTGNDDPDKSGRVKLKFPWLSADYESGWARTMQPGAGAERGFMIIPEVNDEVLVAFEQGDIRRPYVMGGLYNGKDQPLFKNNVEGGKVLRRGFGSRKGHFWHILDEKGGKEGIAIVTKDQQTIIVLDHTAKEIRITSEGTVKVKASQGCTVEAGGDLEMSGANVKIKASGNFELKGSGMGTVESSGVLTVKGAMVNINS